MDKPGKLFTMLLFVYMLDKIKIATVLDETESFISLFQSKEYSSIQEVIDERN